MKTSDSLANLAPALAKAQGELKAVSKDAVNPHFKNTYASLDTILETVRPTLAKHGLSIIQGANSPAWDEGGRMTAFVVETMLLHSSGEYITNLAVMPLTKADAQGAGGALTYGRRYGVSALLALATEEDDDGNIATAKPVAKPQAKAQPTPTIADDIAAVEQVLGDKAEMMCPKCNGKMWDNRKDKKNPKAPDFKCRDKACDGVIWPPKSPNMDWKSRREQHREEVVAQVAEQGGTYSDDLPF